MAKSKRVAFVLNPGGSQWIGGINYMTNLLRSVRGRPDIVPVVLGSAGALPDQYSSLQGIEYHCTTLTSSGSTKFIARKIVSRVLDRDIMFERVLRELDIDILSHYGQLGSLAKIPTIAWIPDFQHVHMREMFSRAERISRDASFSRIAKCATRVVLSSACAQQDFDRLFPAETGKSRVLQFVSDIGGELPDIPSLNELETKYGFVGPFFHVPNQFWKHKNHLLVVQACAFARAAGVSICVLATGNTTDARHPEYFNWLREKVAELGCADFFKILGIVPHRDLVGLMTHTIALINPSKFEGWSTSVEEGKSLGKSILLSNIPVHVEQDPNDGHYFDVDDSEGLAQLMLMIVQQYDRSHEIERQRLAKSTLKDRFCKFGDNFAAIVKEALSAH